MLLLDIMMSEGECRNNLLALPIHSWLLIIVKCSHNKSIINAWQYKLLLPFSLIKPTVWMNEWIISHEKRKPKASYAVACLTQVIWAELGACKERRKKNGKKVTTPNLELRTKRNCFIPLWQLILWFWITMRLRSCKQLDYFSF